MKTKYFKIFLPVLGFIMLMFSTCQPEEYLLGELISKGDLEYTITQNPNDPNMIILTSLTPGMTPLWIHPMGRSTRVVDTVKIPFAGVYVFTYGVESPGGYVQADPFTLTLTTNNLNYVNDPLWTALTGGVGNEKTWYLDLNADGVSKFFAGPLYFYGTSMTWGGGCDGTDCWNWNPDWRGNTWLMAAADFGAMTFDLKGGAHVTIVHNTIPARGTENGTYFLDAAAKALSMTDAAPLHDIGRDQCVGAWGAIKLLSLTEDAMQLAVLRTACEGPCFLVYNFISKVYSDNWVPPETIEPDPPYNGDANKDLTTSGTTSKTWKIDTYYYPYNWHDLAGKELNTVATYANDPAGFTFSTWTPPYDAAVFGAVSMTLTKTGDYTGSYQITAASSTYDGDYIIDDKNNIDFGQSITFFSGVGGWLSFATTDANTLRIIRSEEDATGNITGIWLGKRDPVKAEYLTVHFKPEGSAGDATAEMFKQLTSGSSQVWVFDQVVPFTWGRNDSHDLDYTDVVPDWAGYTSPVNIDGVSLNFVGDGSVIYTEDNGASHTGLFAIDMQNNSRVLLSSDVSPNFEICNGWVWCNTYTPGNFWELYKLDYSGSELVGIWFGKPTSTPYTSASERMCYHFVKQQ